MRFDRPRLPHKATTEELRRMNYFDEERAAKAQHADRASAEAVASATVAWLLRAMGMTPQDRANHAFYEAGIGDVGREAVNFAFDQVQRIFTEMGRGEVTPKVDDRAEALIAALTRYWIESGGHNNPPRDGRSA